MEARNSPQVLSHGGGVLTPVPPSTARTRARIVGPGRRERDYLERVSELERRAECAERELEIGTRLERGTRRYVDKVEGRLDEAREEAQRHQQAQKRLAVALGALQRENELLRQRLAALPAASAPRRLPRPRKSKRPADSKAGWLARLLGSRA